MAAQNDPYQIMWAFGGERDVAQARLEALKTAAACSLQLTGDDLADELRCGATLLAIAARRGRSPVGVKGALLSVLLSIPSRPSLANRRADALIDVVERLAHAPGDLWRPTRHSHAA